MFGMLFGEHKITLNFSKEGYKKLQYLKKKSQTLSAVQVIRNALALYTWYLDSVKSLNGKIIIEYPNGTTERITFIEGE